MSVLYIYIYTYIYLYLYLSLSLYIYIYIYTYIELGPDDILIQAKLPTTLRALKHTYATYHDREY